MKKSYKVLWILLLVLIASSIAVSCGDDAITVGSKKDTEGSLLGKMTVIALREAGLPVEDKTTFGVTEIMRNAVISGEIDIYPEYTGNGAFFFDGEAEASVWKSPKTAYDTVKKLDYDKNKIVWLTPVPANNTWAIAVRKDLADRENLRTLEDFAEYVNLGGEVKLACSAEFVESDAALPSFQEGYGFTLENSQLLILSGGNTAQTEKAAGDGTDGVNFAMAYGTDGGLSAHNLIILEDTKGIQPVYEPAPIIREEVLNEYPKIKDILKPIYESLDLKTLQTLNAKIAIEGVEPTTVAREYLKANNFIK